MEIHGHKSVMAWESDPLQRMKRLHGQRGKAEAGVVGLQEEGEAEEEEGGTDVLAVDGGALYSDVEEVGGKKTERRAQRAGGRGERGRGEGGVMTVVLAMPLSRLFTCQRSTVGLCVFSRLSTLLLRLFACSPSIAPCCAGPSAQPERKTDAGPPGVDGGEQERRELRLRRGMTVKELATGLGLPWSDVESIAKSLDEPVASEEDTVSIECQELVCLEHDFEVRRRRRGEESAEMMRWEAKRCVAQHPSRTPAASPSDIRRFRLGSRPPASSGGRDGARRPRQDDAPRRPQAHGGGAV